MRPLVESTGKEPITLHQVMMTNDDNGNLLLYVKPEQGKSITVYPDKSDVKLFFGAFRTPDFDKVRAMLGHKYYALVQEHPEKDVKVLMPDTKGVDLSRISKVNIAKDKYRDNTTILFATIDGVEQKPVELNQTQARRFWMADDKDAYKTALAAQIFYQKLCPEQAQHDQQEQEKEEKPTEEKEEEPKRGIHF
jgi:hypothetical protein